MKLPYFTVLIDAYNYGRYIEEAVASVLAQDFPREEREILVVDDGSTDDTAARLRKFGNAIRYLYKSNGGQASAFNYGFANASGEVIALLDADDVWLPEKLSRLREIFQQDPDAGMAYHRLYWWDGANGTEADRYFIPISGHVTESRSALLQYPMASTSCLAFRRAAAEQLLPVPETLRSQAEAFLTALVIFITPIVAVEDYLGKYRLHATNVFQTAVAKPSRDQIQHRMAMRAALLAEIQKMAAQERPRCPLGRSARLPSAMEEGAVTRWICAPSAGPVEILLPFARVSLDVQRGHDPVSPCL